MPDISVVIPVGPYEGNKQYLQQAIDSVLAQTHKASQILLIDDMANLDPQPECDIWRTPWLSGVAHAFNFGVALAKTECVFMLGSDDWLEPRCLEFCAKQYEDPLAYYYVGVQYTDGRTQDLPCHAAMVTKTLWRHTGGLPTEASSGASDAAFISILLGNQDAGTLIKVNRGVPLYNYRVHDDTDTYRRYSWQGVILETRRVLTNGWRPCDNMFAHI